MAPQGNLDFWDQRSRPLLGDVPSELMKYTTNLESFEDFQWTGYEVYTMLEAASLKHDGKALHAHRSLLDFGCGAGRILQFVPATLSRSGCDVNAPLTDFVRSEFANADIYTNGLEPPLKWADESFDLIYSFSVFSHLTLENENDWLSELKRVGAPGCLYLVTVHGDWFIEATCPAEERKLIERDGFFFRTVHLRTGDAMDFPEGYEVSYHTSDFVRQHWGRNFEILEIYKGNSTQTYRFDGMRPGHANALSNIRPMGQDLVVMRKPD